MTPAIRSARRTTSPSRVAGISAAMVWVAMPSRTSQQRFSPCPSSSMSSTTLTDWWLWRNGSSVNSPNASSPARANAAAPRSRPRAIASVRSSLSRSARLMVRAIRQPNSVWSMRERYPSPPGASST